MEVRGGDGTWRADVLASSHDGSRRIAWEAQLSPITNDDIQARTQRYRDEGIDVCWVSPIGSVPWIGTVPSIRVRDPNGSRPWTVIDGVAGFRYQQGTWIIPRDLELGAFIRWVSQGLSRPHPVLPRYRRIWFPSSEHYARRHMIWTTQRSIDEEARHEIMRQRQEAWRRQREEEERQVEQRRQESEARQREIQRLEDERLRKIRDEELRVRREELHRQWLAEAEVARQEREAEERKRQEHAAALERKRQEQEQHERQAADRWWRQVSREQVQELRDAVAAPEWKKNAARLEFDDPPSADTAYGVGIYLRHRLYGILRPSPASVHRLHNSVHIFVRNAREAQLIIRVTPKS